MRKADCGSRLELQEKPQLVHWADSMSLCGIQLAFIGSPLAET